MDKSNNAIAIAKEKQLSKLERNNPRLANMFKRSGKVLGYGAMGFGLLTAGIAGSIIGGPIIAPIASITGFAGGVFSLTKSGINIIFQNEDDLLFAARRGIDGTLKLFQRFDKKNPIKGLNSIEMGGLMTLNTLVGLERYKSLMNTKKYEISESGKKIYDQKFSTKTHRVNIKNFEQLQEQGYIKIDNISEKQGETSLLVEKMGIGNKQGALKYIRDAISGKIEKNNKVDLHTISFRLTDKKIDLAQMYEEFQFKDRIEQRKDRIGRLLFDKNGILNKVGIEYDSIGRAHINYRSKINALDTFQTIRENRIKNKNTRNAFLDSLQNMTYDENMHIIEKQNSQKRLNNQKENEEIENDNI